MIRCIFFFVGLLLVTSGARGMLLSTSMSVEQQVLEADCVVAGVVEEETVAASPVPGVSSGKLWNHVRVRVTETFLGPSDASVDYWVPANGRASAFGGKECLFILVEGKRYASPMGWRAGAPIFAGIKFTTAVRTWDGPMDYHLEPCSVEVADIPAIPNSSLVPFTDRADLYRVVREYCKRPRTVVGMENVASPFVYPRSALTWDRILFIPLDSSAESFAQGWIGRADKQDQWNGLRVLRHFPSARNAALLEGLVSRAGGSLDGDLILAVAQSTLVSWGEPVNWGRPKVLARGAVPYLAYVVFLIGVCAAVLVMFRLRAERRSRFRRWVVYGWRAGVVFILLLWGFSFLPVIGAEGGKWQVGGVNGTVYVTWLASKEAPFRRPWAIREPQSMEGILTAMEPWWRWEIDRPFFSIFRLTADGAQHGGTFPRWEIAAIARLPLWLLGVVWALPWVGVEVISLLSKIRLRQTARGYPVVLEGEGRGS